MVPPEGLGEVPLEVVHPVKPDDGKRSDGKDTRVELEVRFTLAPLQMVVNEAFAVTVGAGITTTTTL
jgi:hypothetical protein